jgi:hypothetical protein
MTRPPLDPLAKEPAKLAWEIEITEIPKFLDERKEGKEHWARRESELAARFPDLLIRSRMPGLTRRIRTSPGAEPRQTSQWLRHPLPFAGRVGAGRLGRSRSRVGRPFRDGSPSPRVTPVGEFCALLVGELEPVRSGVE